MDGRQLGSGEELISYLAGGLALGYLPLDLLSGRSTFHLPCRGVGSSELHTAFLSMWAVNSVSPGNNMWGMQASGLPRPQVRP